MKAFRRAMAVLRWVCIASGVASLVLLLGDGDWQAAGYCAAAIAIVWLQR